MYHRYFIDVKIRNVQIREKKKILSKDEAFLGARKNDKEIRLSELDSIEKKACERKNTKLLITVVRVGHLTLST